MKKVYSKYFQKSKIFLYPLLGIERGLEFVPANTYICWDTILNVSDYKLICVYENKNTLEFKNFVLKKIKSNKLFEKEINQKEKQIYIFSLKFYQFEFDNFIEGHYSKYSKSSKNKILLYFKETRVYMHIKSFLEPELFHKDYSELLDVDLKIIKKVHELCDKPDLKKETLQNI